MIRKYETFSSVNSWCLIDLLQVDLVLIPGEKASSPAKELHRGHSATERAKKSRGRLFFTGVDLNHIKNSGRKND